MSDGKPMKNRGRWVFCQADLDTIQRLIVESGANGISCRELIDKMPMPLLRIRHLVRMLTKAGKAAQGPGALRWARYYTPARAAELLRGAFEREAAKAEAEDGQCLWPVSRVVRPALQSKPLRPAGPRSVFELAGAMR